MFLSFLIYKKGAFGLFLNKKVSIELRLYQKKLKALIFLLFIKNFLFSYKNGICPLINKCLIFMIVRHNHQVDINIYKAYKFRMYLMNNQKAYNMCNELKELVVEYPFLKEVDIQYLKINLVSKVIELPV